MRLYLKEAEKVAAVSWCVETENNQRRGQQNYVVRPKRSRILGREGGGRVKREIVRIVAHASTTFYFFFSVFQFSFCVYFGEEGGGGLAVVLWY